MGADDDGSAAWKVSRSFRGSPGSWLSFHRPGTTARRISGPSASIAVRSSAVGPARLPPGSRPGSSRAIRSRCRPVHTASARYRAFDDRGSERRRRGTRHVRAAPEVPAGPWSAVSSRCPIACLPRRFRTGRRRWAVRPPIGEPDDVVGGHAGGRGRAACATSRGMRPLSGAATVRGTLRVRGTDNVDAKGAGGRAVNFGSKAASVTAIGAAVLCGLRRGCYGRAGEGGAG